MGGGLTKVNLKEILKNLKVLWKNEKSEEEKSRILMCVIGMCILLFSCGVKEEAAAYFADQKRAEEVAEIIQSRV